MRIFPVFMTATLLALTGCSSLLGRTSSSEDVQSAYAGTASMTSDQVRQLLHNKGYNRVTDLHENGNNWVGAATSSTGKPVVFNIDKNGVIHTQ